MRFYTAKSILLKCHAKEVIALPLTEHPLWMQPLAPPVARTISIALYSRAIYYSLHLSSAFTFRHFELAYIQGYTEYKISVQYLNI